MSSEEEERRLHVTTDHRVRSEVHTTDSATDTPGPNDLNGRSVFLLPHMLAEAVTPVCHNLKKLWDRFSFSL